MTKAEIIKRRLFPIVSRSIPLEGLVSIGTGGRMVKTPTRESVEFGFQEVLSRVCSDSYLDQFLITWETCWASEVTLTVALDTMKVVLGWSSTHRNVAHAMAAISLYQAAVQYAAQIQATMEDIVNSRDYQDAEK